MTKQNGKIGKDEFWREKKVLITGHTGFKGVWLAIVLQEMGANLFGISDSDDFIFWKAVKSKLKIKSYIVDIRDKERMNKCISEIDPEITFHLAAQSLVIEANKNPLDCIETNVLGTAIVLDAFKKCKNKNISVITTDKVYENNEDGRYFEEFDKLAGKDIYSMSKSCAELVASSYFHSYFSESSVSIQTYRSGNVIGGGDFSNNRLIPDIVKAWNNSEPLSIRNIDAVRPWQHVLEPLSGYVCASRITTQISSKEDNKSILNSWNFGPSGNQKYTVKRLVEEAGKYFDFDYKVIENPIKESGVLSLNSNKALIDLGWKSKLSFEKTIEMTCLWYQEYYSNNQNIYNYTVDQVYEYFDW